MVQSKSKKRNSKRNIKKQVGPPSTLMPTLFSPAKVLANFSAQHTWVLASSVWLLSDGKGCISVQSTSLPKTRKTSRDNHRQPCLLAISDSKFCVVALSSEGSPGILLRGGCANHGTSRRGNGGRPERTCLWLCPLCSVLRICLCCLVSGHTGWHRLVYFYFVIAQAVLRIPYSVQVY
jgi:hypothetical protein